MTKPQLVATSPVVIDLQETGKTLSADLVSFELKDNMVISFNDEDVTLVYDDQRKLYIGTAPGRGDSTFTIQAINPSWRLPE